MTIIRVDPAILRQASQGTSGIGATLSQVGGSVLSKASSAPSYDGQFGPRVQAIGHEALGRAQGLSGRMNDLSGQLRTKAQAFETADTAGVAGLKLASLYFPSKPKFVSVPSRLLPYQWPRWMRLRSNISPSLFWWFPIPVFSLLISGLLSKSLERGILPPLSTPQPSPPPSPPPPPPKKPVKPVPAGKNFQGYSAHHPALDIDATKGDDIQASYKGKVVYAKAVNAGTHNQAKMTSEEWGKSNIVKDEGKNFGYGNSVIIEYRYDDQTSEVQQLWTEKYGVKSGESIYALYAHLDKIDVNSGTELNISDKIGTVGNDGWVYSETGDGSHLHLEFKVSASNKIDDSKNNWPWGSIPKVNRKDPEMVLPR